MIIARKRARKARVGELIAYYGYADRHQRDPDLCVAWGGKGATSAEGRLVISFLSAKSYEGRDLMEELVLRGYDLSTLRFSVKHHTE